MASNGTSAQNDPFDKRLHTLWTKYERYKELFHETLTFSQVQDSECGALARLAEQLRERWNNSTAECDGLRGMIRNLQSESAKHKEDLKSARLELAEARAKLLEYMQMNARLQTDCAELQRQVDLVREIMQDDNAISADKRGKLAFLDQPSVRRPPKGDSYVRTGASVSMGVDAGQLDYDTTDDNLDGRRRGSGKRRRSNSIDRDEVPVTNTETECDDEGTLRPKRNRHLTPHTPASTQHRALRRSFSTPDVAPPQQPPYNVNALAASKQRCMQSVADLRSPRPVDSWTGGAPIESRPHVFGTQTVLRPESCDACRARILFSMNAVRCEDCGILCHSDCRSGAPLPCVPRPANAPSTPKSAAPSARFRLADLVPPKPPMIPRAVICLVKEIEARGMDEVGLYRMSGSECAVNALLVRLHTQRAPPDLRSVDDVATLTSCLKRVLTNLKEPLIPTSSWRDFVAAAELFSAAGGADADWGAAYSALAKHVDELMRPNHDTLAYLCLHWQRVADRAGANKMTVDNLSKCLGPTVVGYSTSAGIADFKRAHDESIKQEAVMRALLSMPSAFWLDRISYDSQPLVTGQMSRCNKNTPELCTTMLGSLYGGTTPSSHRPAAGSSRKKKIFASPWLH